MTLRARMRLLVGAAVLLGFLLGQAQRPIVVEELPAVKCIYQHTADGFGACRWERYAP